VRQLSRGIDRSTPLGRRDYAQYLLFCAYGLSNAEIIDLKLEQIDWHAGILHIRRVKNGATVDLPLLPNVAKVEAPYLEAHLFRHSFATRQLERGTPLKVIGDILGHRSCQTTPIYVRTALARLRQLALPVPK
jgi:site-specific recombinase XerD